NYPYIAKSVTDFWHRWHISLSSWFRDYVYIPLGGNRVNKPRFIFNILCVWFLTGFWHGADWNFMAWGVYFGLLLLAEKFFLQKFLDKLPLAFSHLYLIICIAFGWIFFDAESFSVAATRIGYLFGIGTQQFLCVETAYHLRSYALVLLIAFFGCTPVPSMLVKKFSVHNKTKHIVSIMQPISVAAILVMVTAYLVDGSFNPFIYFRF
ncbi:MAG: MBOAT family protein, partial [Defluviitaleaceae bacterium]|nr:MBOAT family protein [Defluviitaleaceae bacterium]